MLTASNFRIERRLNAALFEEHPVWSEYYDYDELDELRSWRVDETHLSTLLRIAAEGSDHPYYPVIELDPLPLRMRIYIACLFRTPTGKELKGFIINPDPLAVGIFAQGDIEIFNSTLPDFARESERRVIKACGLDNDTIFPLTYKAVHVGEHGRAIEGVYDVYK